MTDLTPDHPAVLAALDAETCRARTRLDAYAEDQITQMLDDLASVLTSALPHLTADDLRDTPAGRALMAEAWAEGTLDQVRRVYIGHMSQKTLSIVRERIAGANPYLEGDA